MDCIETDDGFSYTCEHLPLFKCQARLRALRGEREAVSFSPGKKCSEAGCSEGCGCLSHGQARRYGETFRQGCEECVCTQGGTVECTCTQATQRKEIRDLTPRDRKRYQRAIRMLHARPGMWEGYAQMRAEFAPQAGNHAYFLPWHRYFLRLVERELQSLSSCQLAVPYFEWTVDSGSLLSSAAWQAGLFGGDGAPGSDCVPHHPFQGWASRSRWSPCLRRSFNTSVWLPDAVTLQKLVNQGDFQLFSQTLQTFSGLFRLWLGGHMASPLAAYDPLYLSHSAFLDKLWTQWQERHGHRDGHVLERGKAHLRGQYSARRGNVRMKPFGVSPDDVMSSKEQLCVVYVPITLGAPCNVTSSQRQSQQGHNTDARPHNDNKQPSNFNHVGLDHNGFDHGGYDVSGFDSSGWDRQGYDKDGFDHDHIDREGYDVSGYNRYGFNRSNLTWFGMRWDGMFMTGNNRDREDGEREKEEEKEGDKEERREEQRAKVMSELFVDGGYSTYGFDPFGLDRGGFDVFGFRPDGYDKDRCNWFFDGPHYLRFYFHTMQQLSSTNPQALNHITRTCPPITSLPGHWLSQDWMALDPKQGYALIGQPQREWVEPKPPKVHPSMVTLSRPVDVWLPVTPDLRFCFELHWFSGCPLGSAPVTCPDLCREARCRGYREAECRVRSCGSCFIEWLDPISGSHVICQDW
ncbi:uncharacterized protein LOC134021170 [Osmerus eperlanus]|uniref:uncharacterized protein LOC134021170 n=1 Tax=Osmerus eperlanus TaxID=29151 RepID=UPI002E0E011E